MTSSEDGDDDGGIGNDAQVTLGQHFLVSRGVDVCDDESFAFFFSPSLSIS